MQIRQPSAAIAVALLVSAMACPSAMGEDRFTFVIPGDDATASATDMSRFNDQPAGDDGFVQIRAGRFRTNSGRLRIWGLNTCFGANFPEHETAEKVAAHLAKLGVNGLRFHHHDMFDAPRGIWGPVRDGRRQLDPGQVDKLDYFLDQLHRHGIYANLNLHVSRTFRENEGFVSQTLPREARFNKYVLYFEPRMRQQFKEFCRAYLTHTNPYRKLRRVDDPGIAMLEITNENAFSTKGPGIALTLPEPYRSEFRRQWNQWLTKRYKTTDALRKAWEQGNEPLGKEVADVGDFSKGAGPWYVRATPAGTLRAVADEPGPKPDLPALKLDILTKATTIFNHELSLSDLNLANGQLYTLSFWIRADRERTLMVDVSNQGPGHWQPVGYVEQLTIGPKWTHIKRVFRIKGAEPSNSRICFKFGGSDTDFHVAGFSFRPGGQFTSVPAGQSLEQGTIAIPSPGWSEYAQRDARRFMVEVERGFINEITAFLKDDLGVKCPVTASQITYHGAEIVADTCDYADIHGYWQHPRFPRQPWDRTNWNIANTPMVRHPGSDTMTTRSTWRLLDRPFTMSEWNIADPSDYGASTVPFAAMVAGLQDWDGVFFFQYHSNHDRWFDDRISGYFSFNAQPVKLAMLTALAPMFRRGDLPALSDVWAGTLNEHPPAHAALRYRVGIDPTSRRSSSLKIEPAQRLASPDESVVWDASDPATARVTINTPRTRAAWGLIANQKLQLGDVTLEVGPVERDYAAVVLTSLDDQPIARSKRLLLTAVGSAENRNMGWNESRTSVSDQWGEGPTQVNGIPIKLHLPRAMRLHALDGRGKRRTDQTAGPARTLQVGPEHQTLWYELVRPD